MNLRHFHLPEAILAKLILLLVPVVRRWFELNLVKGRPHPHHLLRYLAVAAEQV